MLIAILNAVVKTRKHRTTCRARLATETMISFSVVQWIFSFSCFLCRKEGATVLLLFTHTRRYTGRQWPLSLDTRHCSNYGFVAVLGLTGVANRASYINRLARRFLSVSARAFVSLTFLTRQGSVSHVGVGVIQGGANLIGARWSLMGQTTQDTTEVQRAKQMG